MVKLSDAVQDVLCRRPAMLCELPISEKKYLLVKEGFLVVNLTHGKSKSGPSCTVCKQVARRLCWNCRNSFCDRHSYYVLTPRTGHLYGVCAECLLEIIAWIKENKKGGFDVF